jgi:dipeptidyl aminopeptidase/acylaminoacyl peptidase
MIAYVGTKRGLTDRETGMEDNHVWLMDADGQKRREIGEVMDNFQGNPQWSPDSRAVYFTVQDRGSVHLERLRIAGGRASPEVVVSEPGIVGAISPGSDSTIAYAMATPYDMAELYLKREGAPSERLTNLNDAVLTGHKLADVHPFTFVSNDNKYAVEAFLTCPDAADTSQCPLIVSLHGGPHSQRGRTFNFKNQIYATRGWATLEVNYRGSTGYGQKFADACFGDLDGGEAQDVLYGVSAAVRRNPWIDRDRMGVEGFSYGGQLTEWLITQTNEFKAAIPTAGVANLISQNFMAYYNQYEEMEFGQFVHQGNLMDLLWDRSPLKHVASARTPTMFLHGENDPDVPIAEDEQLYIALKDVGVETVMVRYPREGHGLREAKHLVDSIDRSIAWYEAHFTKPRYPATTNVQP